MNKAPRPFSLSFCGSESYPLPYDVRASAGRRQGRGGHQSYSVGLAKTRPHEVGSVKVRTS